MVIIILILGVLAGIASNNVQYDHGSCSQLPTLPTNVSDFCQFGDNDRYSRMWSFHHGNGHTLFCIDCIVFLIASIVFVYLKFIVAHSQKQVKMNMAWNDEKYIIRNWEVIMSVIHLQTLCFTVFL